MENLFPIEVTVLIAFGEYLKVSYVLLFKRIWWFILLLLIFIVFTALTGPSAGSWSRTLFVILIPTIFLAFLLTWLVYHGVRKNMRTVPLVNQTIKYTFTEDEIEMSAESFSSKTGWDMMIKAREVTDIILIYGSHSTAMLLPLRCFRDERQIDGFRALVREKLGDKAKLKN